MQTVTRAGCFVAAAGLAASAVSAQVETCSPAHTVNGPDVIVGDISGVSNYADDGTSDAFSLGTIGCNIGSAEVNWTGTTDQHPVIAQNLFKMKAAGGYTAFEQIGQSWLKHAFSSFNQGLCCTTCAAMDSSHLGVHCSDPYASGVNGSQSSLGPKFQVNAHTGAFVYPPANPAWTTSTDRRLAAPNAALEVSGASVSYFVDVQYVCPDDAAAGNQNNNTSYRPCTISAAGSEWVMALTDSTQRTRTGIQAWKDNDPAVTETVVDVAETSGGTPTGRIYVSSQATNLGTGFWHYEFAVYNQNSDMGVGAFSVPIGAGATVQNIGFHDVAYRNGDGNAAVTFDGTDWPGVVSAGAVRWATTPFASNANANAIRWGTMYNFRFDANVPPAASGNAVLTTWKTGGSSFNAPAVVPGVLPSGCYVNCDASTTSPCLNVLDFACFANKYAAGDSGANCDASTTPPVLNVLDFACFVNKYAAGCSGC